MYGDTPLMWAVLHGHEAVIRVLLEKGADVNAKNNFDATALLWIVKKNESASIIETLIEAGAKPEFDQKGNVSDQWEKPDSRKILKKNI